MIKDTADACMCILPIMYSASPARENKKHKQDIQKEKGSMCMAITDTYLQSFLSWSCSFLVTAATIVLITMNWDVCTVGTLEMKEEQ